VPFICFCAYLMITRKMLMAFFYCQVANLILQFADAYKLLRKQDNYNDEDINFDFSEYYNRINQKA